MDRTAAADQSALEQVKQGGFACSIGADQRGQSAGFQLKGDAVDGQLLGVAKAELLGAKRGAA